MAKRVFRDALIVLGEYDVSGHHNTIALSTEADTPEATAFGDDTHVMLPGGLQTVGLSAEGFWEADASTERPDLTYWERVGASEVPVLVAPDRNAGDRAFFLDEILSSYNPVDGSIGEAHSFGIEGAAAANLIAGTLMENRTVTASGDGTARQLGQVGSDESLYGALFVTAASGTSPTLDVTVESDVDTSFGDGDETTRLTFSQKTGTGTERLSLAGAITDTHYRVSWTVGGTSPSFTFILALGIL
jgi:hypothetical protein